MNEEDEESESIDQFQRQVNSQEDARNKRKKGKAQKTTPRDYQTPTDRG